MIDEELLSMAASADPIDHEKALAYARFEADVRSALAKYEKTGAYPDPDERRARATAYAQRRARGLLR